MYSCPNSACTLLFPSLEGVIEHLSDQSYQCGVLMRSFDQIAFDDDSGSENSQSDHEYQGIYLSLCLEGPAELERDFADRLDDVEDHGPNLWSQLNTPNNYAHSPPGGATSTDSVSPTHNVELFNKVYHPNRAKSTPGGGNLLQSLLNDQYTSFRTGVNGNPYYPFASRDEWELVRWMTDGCLTQQQIDLFLRLGYVCSAILFS